MKRLHTSHNAHPTSFLNAFTLATLVPNPQACRNNFPDRGIFVWGHNNYGSLGIGHAQGVDEPTLLSLPVESIEQLQILDVAAGCYGFGLLLGDNKPYFTGNLSGTETFTCPRFFVNNPLKVVGFTSGSDHIAVLTDTGRLFMWGQNSSHQVSPETVPSILEPMEIDLGCAVRKVYCGAISTCAMTVKEEWYVWGNNNWHQLLPEAREDITQPTLHSWLTEKQQQGTIKQVLCGYTFVFVITEDVIYGWGQNERGQLGVGHNRTVPHPVVIPISTKVVAKLSVGIGGAVLLKKDATIWISASWIQEVEGKFKDYKFLKLLGTENLRFVSVADASQRVAAVTESGELWIFSLHSPTRERIQFPTPNTVVKSIFGFEPAHILPPWKIQRLLWIGWNKNEKQTCPLASLPKPVIQYIVDFV